MAQDKKPGKSKTVWFGVLTVAASTLAFVGGQDFVQSYPALVAALGIVTGLVTVALRFVTKSPIKK